MSELVKVPIRLGYFYVMLAAVFWAASGSAAKFLFNSGMSPAQLVQIRTTIAAILLAVWIGSRRPSDLIIMRRDIWKILLLGIAIAATQYTYYFAISKIQVAAAILLQYQAPVFVVIYALVFMKERLTGTILLSLTGAILGCYLLVGGYKLDLLHMNRAGVIGGLASALCFAWYSVGSAAAMQRYRSWTVVFYSLLIAAVIWNVLLSPLGAFLQPQGLTQWWWTLFISVFGTVLAFGLYTRGIQLIRPTHASITATLEPITAGLFAYLFLKESMEPLQITGAVIVVGAVLLLQLKREKNPQD
jgi:drug/metabolite transporter (DMT)-like permease